MWLKALNIVLRPLSIQDYFINLQRFRIAGNLRRTRERKSKGEANFFRLVPRLSCLLLGVGERSF